MLLTKLKVNGLPERNIPDSYVATVRDDSQEKVGGDYPMVGEYHSRSLDEVIQWVTDMDRRYPNMTEAGSW